MSKPEHINYNKIAEAVQRMQQNSAEQLSLQEIAEKIKLSHFDFQKLFKDWAGITPEEFQRYISTQHAKQLLGNTQPTLFETAQELSRTAKTHQSLVEIQQMTSGENFSIKHSFAETIFGRILVASTHKGICYMAFSDDDEIAFAPLKKRFPKASFIQETDEMQQNALHIFSKDWSEINSIKLHLKGTDFQLKVWRALLKIPMGNLVTYGDIAKSIQQPKASRAVGTAIGSNPIAFLIPCHRVIQSTGIFGGYMWGSTRKTAIIGWEVAQNNISSIN